MSACCGCLSVVIPKADRHFRSSFCSGFHLTPCALLLLMLMLWHRQAIFESKGDKVSSSAECRIRILEVWEPADRMPTHKLTELSRIKQNLNSIAHVPMMSEHLTHLTSLAVSFCTWPWQYTCLLLCLMLWYSQAIWIERRQVVFLCSVQDSNFRSLIYQIACRLNPTHKPIKQPRIKQNLKSIARPNDVDVQSPLPPRAERNKPLI